MGQNCDDRTMPGALPAGARVLKAVSAVSDRPQLADHAFVGVGNPMAVLGVAVCA